MKELGKTFYEKFFSFPLILLYSAGIVLGTKIPSIDWSRLDAAAFAGSVLLLLIVRFVSLKLVKAGFVVALVSSPFWP